MAAIYVGRHGQDRDNEKKILNGRRNAPLTTLGEAQADAMADKLVGKDIAVIYSSPLTRALQTAQRAGTKLGLGVIVLDDLIEREFGIMSGKPLADIIPLTPAEDLLINGDHHYFLKAEGAEEFKDMYIRIGSVLDFIQQTHPHENAFISGHGDVSKMMQAYYLGWDWKRGLMARFIANCDILVLENGTSTRL